ncbi:MAG: porin family protein [Bacteroidales bacterium]|jgi:outer membrane protein X|nr:porin family protein [Bacteroidales bacterium]
MTKFNFLKKAAILAIAIMATVSVSAQEKGAMSVGGNLAFGFYKADVSGADSEAQLGLGPKFRYSILDQLRAEGSFMYFLPKDHWSMIDVSVNAHWLFPFGEKMYLYPLAGFSYLSHKYSYSGTSLSGTDSGFNIGGGVDYKLSEKLTLNAELKYSGYGDWSRYNLVIGLTYSIK